MADFQRLAPEAIKHFRQGPGFWVKLKLDPWLLILVIAIMAFGLVVLYSGSGASEAAVNKQLARYAVGFFGMVVITQINLRQVQRWMPLLYIPNPYFRIKHTQIKQTYISILYIPKMQQRCLQSI